MAEQRPFPPSPRRAQLARRAGVIAASPHLVAAAAWLGALVAAVATAAAGSARLGAWIARACAAADGRGAAAALDPAAAADGGGAAAALDPAAARALAQVGSAVLELALPVLAAAAVAAVVAHVAQTRAPWAPRRRIPGAPGVPAGAGARAGRSALEVAAAIAFGGTTLAWLWLVAPRLAKLTALDGAGALAATAATLASFVATLAIAWAATGAIDAGVRVAARAGALRMTAAEKREDERLAAADPRWRERRRGLARRSEPLTAMPGASLLVLGDGVAAAIAWDAVRRPVPVRLVAGTGARATQLLALARRHRVPVHRDGELASALAAAGDGPVDRARWPRLAEIIAAVRP